MKHFLIFFIFLFFVPVQSFAGRKPIQIQDKGSVGNHGEYYPPADMPEVYYNSDNLEIIIVADGFADYYDVNIVSQSTQLAVISTQVDGYGDSIDFNLITLLTINYSTAMKRKFILQSVLALLPSLGVSPFGMSAGNVQGVPNNGGQATKMTANSSSVTVNTDPNSTIMLYKHNYIPYIAPLVLQKVNLDHSQYVIASDVIAGSNVDSVRLGGEVVVKAGVEYEIEASGTVTLQGGFRVEKGATFAVYPSSF